MEKYRIEDPTAVKTLDGLKFWIELISFVKEKPVGKWKRIKDNDNNFFQCFVSLSFHHKYIQLYSIKLDLELAQNKNVFIISLLWLALLFFRGCFVCKNYVLNMGFKTSKTPFKTFSSLINLWKTFLN